LAQDGPGGGESGAEGGGKAKRPYLGILFKCCQVYGRIYRTRAGDAYAGHCPRCAQAVRIRIDPDGGVDARFFELR